MKKKNIFAAILSAAIMMGLIPMTAFAGPKTEAAEKNYNTARTAYNSAVSELNTAKEEAAAAETAGRKAAAEADNKNDAVTRAYNAYTNAVNAAKNVDLDALNAAVNKAQAAYDEKNKAYSSGMYGFFRWQVENNINKKDAERALDVLANGKYASYNHEGGDNDATQFKNVLPLEDLLNEGNKLRQNDDRTDSSDMAYHNALFVSNESMAMAEANANVSSVTNAHMGQFNVYENLYIGLNSSDDPYIGWYYNEKKNYDAGNHEWSATTGHYLNLTTEGLKVTGLGRNSKIGFVNNFSGQLSYSQIFIAPWDDTAAKLSVSEYFDLLRQYIATVDPSAEKAALEKAEKSLKDGKDALDAVNKTEEAYKTAQEDLKTANQAKENAEKALEEAKAKVSRKTNAVNTAKQALDKAAADLEEARKAEPTPTATPQPTKTPTKTPTKAPTKTPTRTPSKPSDGSSSVTPKPTTAPTPSKDTDQKSESVPMYRLYNPNSGEHFYTANLSERNGLVKLGWRYEGIGWNAPKSGNPVYRLYNPNAGDHHYTMSEKERDILKNFGWRYEGIGWYSDTAKSVPLYRQYNPNAVSGAHNYTTSKTENDHLVSLGWHAEGIGWYGVK